MNEIDRKRATDGQIRRTGRPDRGGHDLSVQERSGVADFRGQMHGAGCCYRSVFHRGGDIVVDLIPAEGGAESKIFFPHTDCSANSLQSRTVGRME